MVTPSPVSRLPRFQKRTEAHSSSESDEAVHETPKEHLSTFSLFRNGPWGVIHACRQGDDRAGVRSVQDLCSIRPFLPFASVFLQA